MPVSTIDTRMHGLAAATAAYLVRGRGATALVDTGSGASLGDTLAGLDALGVEHLDWIVLTHIHLDHAGACGALAARFPQARIAVHRRGARHVVDPSRLWAGVSAIHGDRTEALWGRPEPIAAERVHAFEDGGTVDLGDRRLVAVETVGHARHHLAWIDDVDGDAFVGDAVGMQPGRHELWRATTPPADFDLDLALGSIARLRAAGPARLWLGHFGAATAEGDPGAVPAILDRAAETLEAWTAAVSELRDAGQSAETLEGPVRAWLARREQDWPPEASQHLDATSPPGTDMAGVLTWLERRSAAG